ncbi:MAG: cation:proton antiporter [Nitrospira sp.]|nr:cation:proton antiporter [Nitrospira sp.]MBS0153130.1 cation:proton antiporter [Nitrospira sp.]MBS0168425.1 cation:proton antiporter [Nitrospira sp.]
MESLSVELVLGLSGLTILVGLGGELIFKRTGIPSVLLLMGFGVLLGPVFHLAEPTQVMKLAPYCGTLALLIILFDGGINLHIMKVIKETPMALMYSVMVFGLTILSVMGFYIWVTQESWLHGLLLGTILGGTAAAIIIPVTSHMPSLRDATKVLLSLDSAISEVFVVVLALALMGTMRDSQGNGHFIREIFHAFWDAIMLALLAGALWARLLAWLDGQALSYMLTMAAILVLYYVAEVIGANGAITILLFGLVLSNMEFLVGHLVKPIRVLIGYELDQAQFALGEFMKRMNEELSFLVRTFFYVLLGLILDFSALTVEISLMSLGLFSIVVFVRAAVTEGLARSTCGWSVNERVVIAAMFPRGVATAVMAFLPTSTGIPGTELFPIYALTVIVLCVLGMTLILTLYQRRHPSPPAESVPAASMS